MEPHLPEAQKPADEVEVIVPISTEWTSLGTGGGIETFLKMFFEHAAGLGLKVIVPCSGPYESMNGSVRFLPLMRHAAGELEFTRGLRHAVRHGIVNTSTHSVVLANEEHYAWAFRGRDVPVLLLSHGVIPEMLGMRHSRLFAWAYRVFIERRAVSGAFRVLAVNAEIRRYYRSRYPRQPAGKFVEVPVGLDLDDLENRPRGDPRKVLSLAPPARFILFVGRLYPEKNMPLFIDAVDLVRRRDDSVEALVVGDGIQADQLQAAMKSRPWLHWIPTVPHSQVLDLMALSGALVVCSQYEAGPLVLLEALGLGVPVVTTDVGRARELVARHSGRIVGANAADMAAALDEVLSGPCKLSKEELELVRSRLDFRDTMDSLVGLIRDAADFAASPRTSRRVLGDRPRRGA